MSDIPYDIRYLVLLIVLKSKLQSSFTAFIDIQYAASYIYEKIEKKLDVSLVSHDTILTFPHQLNSNDI